jgi:type III secretion protein S
MSGDLASMSAFLKQALALTLMLSLPTVIVIAIIGLLVALVQAVTQVQEQSIGFGIKLIAGVVVIGLTAQWMGGEMLNFINALFAAIPSI